AGYAYQKRDFRLESHGRVTLATGRIVLESSATGRWHDFAVAAMRFGGVDFYCNLRPYQGDDAFRAAAERLWAGYAASSLATLLRTAQADFGPAEFGLEHVLPDGRQR